jgi:hypothetical protein
MHEYLHSFTPDEDAAPPAEVRILSLKAAPLSDQQKVRVTIQLTPFKQPPDLAFIILDWDKVEVSSVNMIETILDEINFVMHIRKSGSLLSGAYKLAVDVLYRDTGSVDQKTIDFEIS